MWTYDARRREGVVEVSAFAHDAAELSAVVRLGEASAALRVEHEGTGYRLTGQLRVDDAALWWPHTHGAPHLYPAHRRVVDERRSSTTAVAWAFATSSCGRTTAFALHVNDVPVFCRGACWTVDDIVSLTAASPPLRTLSLRDAGANMVRVGGTMVYEDDAFYRACDELGILVWQDFMFANMDYPAEDEEFLARCAPRPRSSCGG